METDDDIFLIHKRVTNYLKKINDENKNNCKEIYTLITKLLSYFPPHGFTEDDWIKFSKIYEISIPSPRTKDRITYKECKDILKKCEQLQEQSSFEDRSTMYETESKQLIDSYKASINNVIHNDFMSLKKKEVSPEQKQYKNKLINIIENTLGYDVLQQVIKRKNTVTNQMTKEDFTKFEIDTVDDNDEEWNGMVYNDINRINFAIKFKYDKRQHFKDTINQYQGLQHKNIPEQVFKDVVEEIHKHGLADSTKTDPKEKYAKVTKEHIKMFLSQCDHSIYYEDQQLIYSKITTNPCPNIQKYEKALFNDFEKLVEVFLSLPEEIVDRKNFLNTHYVLRQLLKRRGLIVPEHDLNNLKTPARIRAHDDIYQMCCDRLGWNFTPLS
jgi:hypothetical protein